MCPFCSNHFDIGALYMHVRTMYKISAYTSFYLTPSRNQDTLFVWRNHDLQL